MKWRRLLQFFLLTIVMSGLSVGLASANYVSPDYQVNEVFFGSGGTLSTNSSHYSAKAALGETGVGNSSSSNYQIHSGFNTTDVPYLEFIVNSNNIDLGELSVASTSTANGTFSVKSYLSGGYVVQTTSTPPSNGSHTLTALTSATSPTPGTEQFGINLVANTSPTTFGAAPVQVPDSTFSHGSVTAGAPGPNGQSVATGYSTVNKFKYVNGDIIAASNQSSGETDYTISYIFNISSGTPAGQYTFSQVLVATAAY